MIKSEILADSISPHGHRLTTFKVTFPRHILAEVNTHRMFSRNSASSRAIPFDKMVEMVQDNPFIPIAWQKDHKGMQGTEYTTHPLNIEGNDLLWLEARDEVVKRAKMLNEAGGVTKQFCNRLLEAYMWHTAIITSSEDGLENFFKLRCPAYELEHSHGSIEYVRSKDEWSRSYDSTVYDEGTPKTTIDWLKINNSQAEIHIQALAEAMWDNYNDNQPQKLKSGEWHIPYGDKMDEDILDEIMEETIQNDKKGGTFTERELFDQLKLKVSVARCARLSYQTLGANPVIDYRKDIKLHDRLAKMEHWSPAEHVARAMSEDEYKGHIKGRYYRGGDYGYDSEAGQEYQFDTHEFDPFALGWSRNFRGFIQYRATIDKQ